MQVRHAGCAPYCVSRQSGIKCCCHRYLHLSDIT
jgi:hypothetical protein